MKIVEEREYLMGWAIALIEAACVGFVQLGWSLML